MTSMTRPSAKQPPIGQRAWLRRPLVALSLSFGLSHCAIQLAPPYDRAVAEGLTQASVQVMSLFAATSHGTDASSFATREHDYNTAIGKIDALAIQANARPAPDPQWARQALKALASKGEPFNAPISNADPTVSAPNSANGAPSENEIPSVSALHLIAETLEKMRDTDRKQGVTAFESALFKRQATIYFDQAMTYEAYLKR